MLQIMLLVLTNYSALFQLVIVAYSNIVLWHQLQMFSSKLESICLLLPTIQPLYYKDFFCSITYIDLYLSDLT